VSIQYPDRIQDPFVKSKFRELIDQANSDKSQLSVGISGTVTIPKLTNNGANGSITFVNGIVTSFTGPT
jgi:hypothetical protein